MPISSKLSTTELRDIRRSVRVVACAICPMVISNGGLMVLGEVRC